jgi:hypothetical protein
MKRNKNMSSYTEKVLRLQQSDFVGYWPLNEESGTAVYDLSPNGYNGTSSALVRTPATSGFRAPDGSVCAQFDGTSSYIDLYDATAAAVTTPGTMSIWVATPQANLSGTTKMQIFKFAADANNFIDLTFDTTAYRFNAWHEGNTTAKSVNSPLKYNVDGGSQLPEWHHFAFSFADGGSLTFYTDGVAETAATSLGTFTGSMAEATMVLGSSSTTVADQFTGYLAHFAWWNKALGQTEIEDLYDIGL